MKYLIIILFISSASASSVDINHDKKGVVMAIDYLSGIWNNYKHSDDIMKEIKKECGDNYFILQDDNSLNNAANKTLKIAYKYDSGSSLVVYRCVTSSNLDELYGMIY